MMAGVLSLLLLILPLALCVYRGEDVSIFAGVPKYYENLPQYATQCFTLDLKEAFPDHVPYKVAVSASVVALGGDPALTVGFQKQEALEASGPAGGFQLYREQLKPEGDQLFLCVRTFSEQGCDFLITAQVSGVGPKSDASDAFYLYGPNYPSLRNLTRLDEDPATKIASTTFRYDLPKDDMNSYQVIVTPIEGDPSVSLIGAQDCQGSVLVESSVKGAEFLELDHATVHKIPSVDIDDKTVRPICIKVDMNMKSDGSSPSLVEGVVSVVLARRDSDTSLWLPQGVPTAGRITAKDSEYKYFRLLVNNRTGLTVTAVTSRLDDVRLVASFDKPGPTTADCQFDSLKAMGHDSNVLLINGNEIPDTGDRQLFVGLTSRRNDRSQTYFTLTATSATNVITLLDAHPYTGLIPVGTNAQDTSQWLDFQFYVAHRGVDVMMAAESYNGVVVMAADTEYHSSDPRQYAWKTPNAASRVSLQATTVDEHAAASDMMHLITPPCFIYITLFAFAAQNSTEDARFQVTVTTSAAWMNLVEGRNAIQSVANHPDSKQIFLYRIPAAPDNHTATSAGARPNILFAVTSTEGAVVYRVSSRSDFPADSSLTTPVVTGGMLVLNATHPVYQDALRSTPADDNPTLYVMVVPASPGRQETMNKFSITARAEDTVVELQNGATVSGQTRAHHYDRYKVYVPEPVNRHETVQLQVSVVPISGDPDVFVSNASSPYPDRDPHHHSWMGELEGGDQIVISSTSPSFSFGWLYIGITCDESSSDSTGVPAGGSSSYLVTVNWGHSTSQLWDGLPLQGAVTENDQRVYELVVQSMPERGVALRTHVEAGSVELCMWRTEHPIWRGDPSKGVTAPTISPIKPNDPRCHYKAWGGMSSPIMIDIPPSAAPKGGVFYVVIVGKWISNVYAITAALANPFTLVDGQTFSDFLSPASSRLLRFWIPPSLIQRAANRPAKSRGTGPAVQIQLTATNGGLDKVTVGGGVSSDRVDLVRGEAAAESPRDLLMSVPVERLVQAKGGGAKGPFWLYLQVDTPHQLNYTITANAGTRAQRLEVDTVKEGQLPPNEDPHDIAYLDVQSTTYQLRVPLPSHPPPPSSQGIGHITVTQCYGSVGLALASTRGGLNWYSPSPPLWMNGQPNRDVKLPIPYPHDEDYVRSLSERGNETRGLQDEPQIARLYAEVVNIDMPQETRRGFLPSSHRRSYFHHPALYQIAFSLDDSSAPSPPPTSIIQLPDVLSLEIFPYSFMDPARGTRVVPIAIKPASMTSKSLRHHLIFAPQSASKSGIHLYSVCGVEEALRRKVASAQWMNARESDLPKGGRTVKGRGNKGPEKVVGFFPADLLLKEAYDVNVYVTDENFDRGSVPPRVYQVATIGHHGAPPFLRPTAPGFHVLVTTFILLVVLFVSYCALGALYKTYVYGSTGLDALPNYYFWARTFPFSLCIPRRPLVVIPQSEYANFDNTFPTAPPSDSVHGSEHGEEFHRAPQPQAMIASFEQEPFLNELPGDMWGSMRSSQGGQRGSYRPPRI
ncbi:unnamed protein product [Vitrella brassicaformis CCMP3155]|uniref:Cadherin domain-containing protein n=5 Tax=Vitrella brassicaformis TaxID=1169539 RepID=A0A0G4EDD7_VITBC|nr:unnamed protein product [Vitrella brassicaformis CCMP3155]|eukprot:CEL93364.1 unnamed protein product [Vitrella brassicaformis CCMP3155]